MDEPQQMPVEFPTDEKLLDGLQQMATDGFYWVCRKSTTDRGVRLHEITLTEAQTYDLVAHPTARLAIAAAMGVHA